MHKILLITAINEEVTELVKKHTQKIHDMYSQFIYGEKLHIEVVTCGVGMINAAMITSTKLDTNRYDQVWMIGCCGGYDIPIGDVIMATEEVNADLGIQEQQWLSPQNFPFAIVKGFDENYVNSFPCYNYRTTGNFSFDVHYGRMLSTSTVSGCPEHAYKLQDRFCALGENMEGAAVAQVCAYHNKRFIEIRGVSNVAGDRCKANWDFQLAWKNSEVVVIHLWNMILEQL